jgi:hypothetical protein
MVPSLVQPAAGLQLRAALRLATIDAAKAARARGTPAGHFVACWHADN